METVRITDVNTVMTGSGETVVVDLRTAEGKAFQTRFPPARSAPLRCMLRACGLPPAAPPVSAIGRVADAAVATSDGNRLVVTRWRRPPRDKRKPAHGA